MSENEESSIDHLVAEALDGGTQAEAAEHVESETPSDEVEQESPKRTLTFAPSDEEPTNADVDEDIDQIRAERDAFLADTQRLTADFANYRKQSDKRVMDTAATQSASLIRDLIPILDACDSALVQDPDSAVGPIRSALIGELEKNGLELLAPTDSEVFDPEQHEAVMHEPAPDDSEFDVPVVGEVFRAGYTWKGRVVRPAMVKVVG